MRLFSVPRLGQGAVSKLKADISTLIRPNSAYTFVTQILIEESFNFLVCQLLQYPDLLQRPPQCQCKLLESNISSSNILMMTWQIKTFVILRLGLPTKSSPHPSSETVPLQEYGYWLINLCLCDWCLYVQLSTGLSNCY